MPKNRAGKPTNRQVENGKRRVRQNLRKAKTVLKKIYDFTSDAPNRPYMELDNGEGRPGAPFSSFQKQKILEMNQKKYKSFGS